MIVYNIQNWNMQSVFKDLEKGYHTMLDQPYNLTQFQIEQTTAVSTFTVYSSLSNTYIKQ
jgi:septation ring formation regulator EzrA